MPSHTLITDSKISNQARINPQKIAPSDEASFLITQKDKKYQSKKIHGDGTVDSNGKLTIVQPSVPQAVEESLPNGTVKVGTSSGKNEYVKLGSKAGEIAVRDANGFLFAKASESSITATTATKADTANRATRANIADKADLATNADKLDDQEGTHYLDVTNHTAGTSTAVTGASGILNHTTQTVPTRVITAVSTGNCSDVTDFVVEHSLGTMPLDVKVFEGSSTTEEVEVEVESTTTQSTVKFSPPGPSVDFTIKILGVKE
jgi:hypothetical protein